MTGPRAPELRATLQMYVTVLSKINVLRTWPCPDLALSLDPDFRRGGGGRGSSWRVWLPGRTRFFVRETPGGVAKDLSFAQSNPSRTPRLGFIRPIRVSPLESRSDSRRRISRAKYPSPVHPGGLSPASKLATWGRGLGLGPAIPERADRGVQNDDDEQRGGRVSFVSRKCRAGY